MRGLTVAILAMMKVTAVTVSIWPRMYLRVHSHQNMRPEGEREDALVTNDDSSDVGDTVHLNDCDRLRHLLHVDHLVRSDVHSQPNSHYPRTPLVSKE